MKTDNFLNFILTAFLLLLIPCVYIYFWGRYGWSNTDDGFIFGYGWRIFNGEVPYKDFIYVRPPSSLFINYLIIKISPTNITYALTRYISNLEILLYSFLSISTLIKLSGKPYKFKWLLIITSYLISASVFTPMPWHTIDGIFFAVLAAFLLNKEHNWIYILLSAFSLVISILCKQSFYPLVFFFALFIFITKPKHVFYKFTISTLFFVSAFIFLLKLNNCYEDFINQTTGATNLLDLKYAGIDKFLEINSFQIFLVIATIVLRLTTNKNTLLLAIALASCSEIYSFIQNHIFSTSNYYVFQHNLSQFYFYLAVTAIVFELKRINPDFLYSAALFIAVAWCASISWAITYPILFIAPIFTVCFLTLERNNHKLYRNFYAPSAMLLLCLTGLINSYTPSGDKDRHNLNCDMGTTSKKLSYIFSTQENCEKILDLIATSSDIQPYKFTLSPATGLGYFILNKKNPTLIDWPLNAELGSLSGEFIANRSDNTDYIIEDIAVAKEFPICDEGKFCMGTSKVIHDTWEVIMTTKYHRLYKNPVPTIRND